MSPVSTSVASSDRGPVSAWTLSVTAVALALAVAVVLETSLVHGPLTLRHHTAAIATGAAAALGLAAAATSLTLRPVGVAWHADAVPSLIALIGLAGMTAAGWEDAPNALRSVGSVAAPLVVPALLRLVEGRAPSGRRWGAVALVVVAALSLATYAVRDPFRDPGCWADCTLRDVATRPSSEAARLAGSVLAGTVLAAAAVVVSLAIATVHRGVRSTAGARLDIVLVTAAAVSAVAWAADAVVTDRAGRSWCVTVASTALCATAATVALQPASTLRRRHELARLAVALGEQPPLGALEATLSKMLGDRSLRVAYWLAESRRYVDSAGAPVDDISVPAVVLTRGGEPLARVHLARSDGGVPRIEEVLGSAARLAIDNERLQAEVRAQLAELVSARQRIVTAADDARRSVERTIHDAVQAELVGALLELARECSEAERDGRVDEVREAAAMRGQVQALVAELRDFARGVYPAVLDGAGLAAALAALADEAPVALTIDCRVDAGPANEAQRTAYLLVHDAAGRAVADLDVEVVSDDGLLLMRIAGHPPEVRDDLVDRVGALGGTVELDRNVLEAVLPCG